MTSNNVVKQTGVFPDGYVINEKEKENMKALFKSDDTLPQNNSDNNFQYIPV